MTKLPLTVSLCLLAPSVLASAQQPLAVAAASAFPATSAPPSPNTLLDGTAIKLRLAETISSATANEEQSVAFEVVDEVKVMGVPVILKGAQALGTVTTARSRKSMGRGGKLEVNIESVRLGDSERADLRATEAGRGGGHVGAMTTGIVATAIVFFPAAPLSSSFTAKTSPSRRERR